MSFATKNLKFVFIQPESDIAARFFSKFCSILKSNGFLTSYLHISNIGALNLESSFYYKRIIICHQPTVIDCLKHLKQGEGFKGSDTLVQFLLNVQKSSITDWSLYQTVISLNGLYPRVFGLDISQDYGVYSSRDRLRSQTSAIYRFSGGGGGFNLNENNKPLSFYPKRDTNTKLRFDVGLIISTSADNF